MEKIQPFTEYGEALSTLDNGGRFYNLLTKADDGNISAAELGKVAGLFSDKQQMVLYYAMSVSSLERPDRDQLKNILSDDLKAAFEKYVPQVLIPSEAESKGKLSSNAIVTGVPRLVESKTEFCGFIMIPIMTGKSVTFIMAPIMDKYDVYEIRDDETSGKFLIAHARGEGKLPEERIKVGGVLKELQIKKGDKEVATMFLEALYYADADQ